MRWIRECSFFILGFAMWVVSIPALPHGTLDAGETPPTWAGVQLSAPIGAPIS